MMEIASDRGVQLIPSLVDFGIGRPQDGVRDEKRTAIITDNRRKGCVLQGFYQMTLATFLNISDTFEPGPKKDKIIYALGSNERAALVGQRRLAEILWVGPCSR